ncbi:MAG: undecaprenyl-phosphate glucose phosphotransferase [Endozoicomonas sp.]
MMPVGYSLAHSRLPVFLFVGLDLFLSFFSSAFSLWLRFGSLELSFGYQAIELIQALLVVGLSTMLGVYDSWRARPLGGKLFKVFLAWFLSFVLLVAFMVMTKTTENYSRVWLGAWIICATLLALVVRWSIHGLLKHLRRHGRNSRRVLVIGNGRNFRQIKGEMDQGNDWGYRLDVCLEYENRSEAVELLSSQLVRDDQFDECWLCLPLKDNELINDVMHLLRHHTMDIRYMPGMRDMPLLNHKVTPIAGFYSLDLSCSPMDDINHSIKRIEDVVLASLIILLISPVMLAVAITVKLSSSGPVLFKQYRHGANGKRIKVYKFRSMKVHEEKAGQVTQASKNDSRITPVGSFIRRTSLDELPQFINVIQGRMSIVGPRPHAMAHNEEYKDLVDSYMKRHKVKPGITGLAQVNGFRGETDTLDKMQKRVEMDLKYINTWSLFLDLKIIFLTVFKGFVNPNAY